MTRAETPIRLASASDAPAFATLLHAFSAEFGESTPDDGVIAERAAPLIESGEVTVLFVGDGPDGFAQLRFRPSLYRARSTPTSRSSTSPPKRRGHGLGRALLEATCAMRASAAPSAPPMASRVGRREPRSRARGWGTRRRRSALARAF